jgi:glycosyltransferase involved in cell wall biosynthesis
MNGLVPIVKMTSGCDYHRLWLPLLEMGMDMNRFSNKTVGDFASEIKILLFNRVTGGPIEDFVKMRKEIGFKIVMDLDDYWELYPNHILYNHWYATGMNTDILAHLRAADAVIVTTSLLADKVKEINPNVHVIPNTIPYDKGQFRADKEESEFTRFMYAGGSSHFRDIQCLKVPFQKTLNNPAFKKGQFILAGYDDKNLDSKLFWDKMSRALSLNGKLKNFTTRGTLPLQSYMNHYNHSDVTLAPLEDYIFNRYKSNLKILESAAKYVPIITSKVSPYIEFPAPDFVNFAHNASSWYDTMNFYVKNPQAAKDHGQNLGEYCRANFDMKPANEHRRQLFESLMS